MLTFFKIKNNFVNIIARHFPSELWISLLLTFFKIISVFANQYNLIARDFPSGLGVSILLTFLKIIPVPANQYNLTAMDFPSGLGVSLLLLDDMLYGRGKRRRLIARLLGSR